MKVRPNEIREDLGGAIGWSRWLSLPQALGLLGFLHQLPCMNDFQKQVTALRAANNAQIYSERYNNPTQEDGSDWSGPGAKETARRVEKYHHLVETAMTQTPHGPATDLIGVPGSAGDRNALELFAPHEPELYRRSAELSDLYHNGLQSWSPQTKYKSFLQVDQKGESLFRYTKELLKKLNLYGTGFRAIFPEH